MFLVWNGAVWSTGICMYRFKQLCLLLPELKQSKYLFQHWSFLIYILPMHFSEHPCFHSIPSLFFLPDRSTFHFVVIAVSSLFWLTDEQRRSRLETNDFPTHFTDYFTGISFLASCSCSYNTSRLGATCQRFWLMLVVCRCFSKVDNNIMQTMTQTLVINGDVLIATDGGMCVQ